MAKSLFIYFFFFFLLDLLHKEEVQEGVQEGVQESVTCHRTDVTQNQVTWQPWESSVQEIYEDFIEFFLSSADKEVVGFILAQELAILTPRFLVKISAGFLAPSI